MYDFGSQFYIDMTKSKTPSSYVFMGKTYRISILSDALIRFEYSEMVHLMIILLFCY